ncbi:hypothetical protein ACFQ3K_17000 [Brucella gallinifaecis]|uniref:Uncharacterized protein n=1 Tax=Brucella gallinifaecis TaxID=215590 RepID=A0A502BJ11_9HYPH|nr:hypothetical protein [Brucella gallinifaecis]TPF73877.1 hypothetical protein FHY56_17525 [Brucella gallinifaecis]
MYQKTLVSLFVGIQSIGQAIANEIPESIKISDRETLLKVDEFSPSAGRLSINYGMNYTSQDKSGYIPNFLYTFAGDGTLVYIPTIQATQDRTDTATANFGVRYNVASRFNLSAQINGGYRYERNTSPENGLHNSSSFDFNSLTIGTDFHLLRLPRGAINAFLSVGAVEKTRDSFVYGKSFNGGLTGYWTVDPIILSTTVAYSKFMDRKSDNTTINPGDAISVSPSVGFAVNPDMNLSWGMTFAFKDAVKVNENKRNAWQMLSTVNLGLGYRIDENKLLNVTGRAGVGGNSAAQFGMNVSQRF